MVSKPVLNGAIHTHTHTHTLSLSHTQTISNLHSTNRISPHIFLKREGGYKERLQWRLDNLLLKKAVILLLTLSLSLSLSLSLTLEHMIYKHYNLNTCIHTQSPISPSNIHTCSLSLEYAYAHSLSVQTHTQSLSPMCAHTCCLKTQSHTHTQS